MCQETFITCTPINDAKDLFPKLAERAVCINLLQRDDRLKSAQEQFTKVGLIDKIEFHRVERHPRGGRYGCYNSHREVMQKALDDGIKSLLIFEDDVQFKAGWEKVVIDTKEFVDSGAQFDAYFLGMKLLFVDEEHTSNVLRVKCSALHAYIVSRSGMETFISNTDRFENEIVNFPHDFTQNSLWTHIYGHEQTESIAQALDLGTDNPWLPDIPVDYVHWLQMHVLGKFERWVFPLQRQKWFRNSWVGRRYVIGIGNYWIDDGRIRLMSTPMLDEFLTILFIIFTYPPFGYLAFLSEFVYPMLLSRFRKQKNM